MRKKDDVKWATKQNQIETRKSKKRKRARKKYRFDKDSKKYINPEVLAFAHHTETQIHTNDP